ncbi:MAG: hypothetical protein JSV24_08720, partial [Bacteroidales bacterium]
MRIKHGKSLPVKLLVLTSIILNLPVYSQTLDKNPELDRKVEAFLESNQYRWRDMNVPRSDGKTLHDLIIKNKYKKALEIG